MWNEFFKHIDIVPENVHILDGNAEDLVAECNSFEAKIKEAGGVELFIGGIGPDGHIAFNEPGSSLTSRTRVKTLAQDTLEANARFFNNDFNAVPKQALTVGVATVMDAKEVMILITGAHKSFALYKAIEEGVNHMWTVSAFQVRNFCNPRLMKISRKTFISASSSNFVHLRWRRDFRIACQDCEIFQGEWLNICMKLCVLFFFTIWNFSYLHNNFLSSFSN